MKVLTAVARRTGIVRTAISSGRSVSCVGLTAEPLASTPATLLLCASCTGRPYSVSSKREQEGDGCRALASRVDGRLPAASRSMTAQQAGGARRSSSSGSSGGSAKPLLKPMRSVLYTPGSSRHLYKIREIACDASLIDLEVRGAFLANQVAAVLVAPERPSFRLRRVSILVVRGFRGQRHMGLIEL